MTDPIANQSGTSAGANGANSQQGEGNNQQQQQNQAGNQSQSKTITVEEFDKIFSQRWGEKLGSLEKDLGVPLKDAKTIIKAAKEAEAANKTELQKLQDENKALKENGNGASIELLKMKAAIEAKVPSEKLAEVLGFVTGTDEESIKASLTKFLAVAGINATAAQGAGQGNKQQGGQKVWSKSEVLTLQRTNPDEYRKHRAEILDQMSKGLIVE